MGRDTQIPGDFADRVTVPVPAQEQIAVFLTQSCQICVQIPGQFPGVVVGFHGGQGGDGGFQLFQGNIVMTVSLLCRVGVIPLQTDVPGDPANVSAQMIGPGRRNPVPDLKICIALAFFDVLAPMPYFSLT